MWEWQGEECHVSVYACMLAFVYVCVTVCMYELLYLLCLGFQIERSTLVQ